MKKKLLSIFAICFVILFAGCTKKDDSDTLTKILKRGKIIVGVKYDTKPFGFINENQQLDGFDVDLAKYIAKFILGDENKIEFKQVTPSNRILSLNSGQVDMVIATMSRTKQRSQVIDFSRPYYDAGQAILVPAKSDIRSMSDLNGKKVIIVFGSTAERNLRQIAPDADIVGFTTYPSGYSALKQGRADAMTSDDTILMGFAMADKSLKLLPTKYSQELYAIAFKKGKDSETLIQRVNFVLDGMEKTGELKQLKNKWIKY